MGAWRQKAIGNGKGKSEKDRGAKTKDRGTKDNGKRTWIRMIENKRQ